MSQQSKTSTPIPSSQTSDSSGEAVRLVTWRKGMPPATFYILAKGHNAGRPMRRPCTNCFAVYTDTPELYAIAYSIYVSGQLRRYLIGSVIPYIRITEYRPILTRAAATAGEFDPKALQLLTFIDEQLAALERIARLYRQYQEDLANSINYHFKVALP